MPAGDSRRGGADGEQRPPVVIVATAAPGKLQPVVAGPVGKMVGLRRPRLGGHGHERQDEHQNAEFGKAERAGYGTHPSLYWPRSGAGVAAAAPVRRAAAAGPRTRPFTVRSAAGRLTEAMRIALAALMLLTALAVSPAAARAFSGNEQDSARKAVESGEIRPLKDILRGVRGRVDGEVLDTQLNETGGSYVYRVKVLGNDGRVRVLMIDARSGQILQVLEGGG